MTFATSSQLWTEQCFPRSFRGSKVKAHLYLLTLWGSTPLVWFRTLTRSRRPQLRYLRGHWEKAKPPTRHRPWEDRAPQYLETKSSNIWSVTTHPVAPYPCPFRPGDGLTVARSLGRVHEQYRKGSDDDDLEERHRRTGPAFVLELYPSEGQRGIAGRFMAEAREKRRSGGGGLSDDDQSMLESLSLPGGVNRSE